MIRFLVGEVFIMKSVVHGERVRSTKLAGNPLIRIFLTKCMEKLNGEEKRYFLSIFRGRRSIGISDNFVEQVKT